MKPRRSDQLPLLTLREDRADAERPPHLLADDDAAERRRQHDRRLHVPGPLRQRGAQRIGKLRVLQDERALQIALAVQPGREPEMPFEERTRLPEKIENGLLIH